MKSVFGVLAAMVIGVPIDHPGPVRSHIPAPSPCASDTSRHAKGLLNRYPAMMGDDSMSVVERHVVAIDKVDPATVVIVTDTTVCRTAVLAYRRALSDTAAPQPVHVVKVGNRYIVHEDTSPVGSGGLLIFDGGKAYLTFDSTFTTKLSQTR